MMCTHLCIFFLYNCGPESATLEVDPYCLGEACCLDGGQEDEAGSCHSSVPLQWGKLAHLEGNETCTSGTTLEGDF